MTTTPPVSRSLGEGIEPPTDAELDLREKMARIIDPDAWHDTLQEDGLGNYWISRRHTARQKVDAILALFDKEGLKVMNDKVFAVAKTDPWGWGRSWALIPDYPGAPEAMEDGDG